MWGFIRKQQGKKLYYAEQDTVFPGKNEKSLIWKILSFKVNDLIVS